MDEQRPHNHPLHPDEFNGLSTNTSTHTPHRAATALRKGSVTGLAACHQGLTVCLLSFYSKDASPLSASDWPAYLHKLYMSLRRAEDRKLDTIFPLDSLLSRRRL
jgi:hypothetical protein